MMRGAFGNNANWRVNIPVGFTVIIGCLATVYILRKGAQYYSQILQRKRDDRENCKANGNCYVCNVDLNSTDTSSYVTCAGCTHNICQKKCCAIWLPQLDVWNCKLCYSFMSGSHTACDWFMQQINKRLVRPDPSVAREDTVAAPIQNVTLTWNESSDEMLVVPVEQRDVVREYIEKMVASIVGGDTTLDRVPIGQLSSNQNYLNLFAIYHLPLSRIVHSVEKSIHLKLCLPRQESNATAAPLDESYENLRRLVEQIIEQVFKIPELLDYSGVPGRARAHAPEFEPKKYEELLATAVLNKIVEKFEREQKLLQNRRDWAENPNGQSNRNLNSANSECSSDEPRSESSCSGIQRRPMSLNVEPAKQNFNIADPGLCSPTSDEEYLSDYIQNHRVPLPDLGAKNCDVQHNPDEEFQSLEANGHSHSGLGGDGEETDESWQNNWMFRKRDAVETLTAVANASIGMLVPSPTEEVKTLIGDRTADEISDLSEAGSDSETELNDAENHVDISHDIVESKTCIRGKVEVDSFHQTMSLQPVNLTTEPLREMRNGQSNPNSAEVEDSLQTLDDVVFIEEKTLVQTTKENDAKHDEPIIVDLMHKSIECDQMPVPVAAPRKHSLVTSIAPIHTSEDDDDAAINVDSLHEIETSIVSVDEQGILLSVELQAINLVTSIVATIEQSIKTLPDSISVESVTDVVADVLQEESFDSMFLPTNTSSLIKIETPYVPSQNKISEISTKKDLSPALQSSEDELLQEPVNEKIMLDYTTGATSNAEKVNNIVDVQSNTVHNNIPVSESVLEVTLLAQLHNKNALLGSIIIPDSNIVKNKEKMEQNDEITENYVAPNTIENILRPPVFEYQCKVDPTEFDISVAEAFKVFQNSTLLEDQLTLIEQILPDVGLVEDTTVPKAILISTTPAIIALDIAYDVELLDHVIPVAVTSEIDIHTTASSLLEETADYLTPSVSEPSEQCITTLNTSLTSAKCNKNNDLIETQPVDNIIIEESIVAETKKPSEILPESPMNIPVVIVSESAEPPVDIKPPKGLAKQSSLEIPNIDTRENFEDIMKLPVVECVLISPTIPLDTEADHIEDNDDYVLVSDAEVAALRLEEEYIKTVDPFEPIVSAACSLNITAQVVEVASHSLESDFRTPSTETNTTNITDTATAESTIQTETELKLTPTVSDVELRKLEKQFIGPIAEREHMKWENVQDVPGNPYSPEALQKRLSTQSLPRDGHLTRLANVSHGADKAEAEGGSIASLVSKPNITRYGRDYYINDAKHAAGKTPDADEWHPIFPASSPGGNNSPEQPTDDYELHTATPIFVGTDPNSNAQLTSTEELSSMAHSSLTPSEGSDTTRVYDLASRQTSLQHNIILCSRLPAHEPAAIQTPPSSPIDAKLEHRQSTKHYLDERSASFQQLAQFKRAIEQNNQPISVTVKPLSSAQQYFGGAKQPITSALKPAAAMDMATDNGESVVQVIPELAVVPTTTLEVVQAAVYVEPTEIEVEVDVQIEVLRCVPEPMDMDVENVTQLSYTDPVIVSKSVIEEEVLPALPSVKALARSFIMLQTTVDDTPINRPKSLNWVNHEASGDEDDTSPRCRSQDTGFPLYNHGYHPMAQVHSITARSLSSKFRDELKGSESTEPLGRISPDRPLSPVLVRGLLKNNIAFYENLNK